MKRLLTAALATLVLAGVLQAQDSAPVGKTVITANRMAFDYKRRIAEFNDNVVVNDPQIRMTADALTVIFSSTNEIKSVTASGNVHIYYQTNEATCKRAIYVAKEAKITLIGDAKLNRGGESLASSEITFWLNDDRVKTGPAKLIMPSEGKFDSGLDDLGR